MNICSTGDLIGWKPHWCFPLHHSYVLPSFHSQCVESFVFIIIQTHSILSPIFLDCLLLVDMPLHTNVFFLWFHFHPPLNSLWMFQSCSSVLQLLFTSMAFRFNCSDTQIFLDSSSFENSVTVSSHCSLLRSSNFLKSASFVDGSKPQDHQKMLRSWIRPITTSDKVIYIHKSGLFLGWLHECVMLSH